MLKTILITFVFILYVVLNEKLVKKNMYRVSKKVAYPWPNG